MMRSDDDQSGTRVRILDAAERLFARHGFDGTSTARLAHAVGVPKGLLFYYFPTKPHILTALLEELLPPGTVVGLEYDQERTDRYDRTLAGVFLEDGTLVNAEIARQGLGCAA